MMLAGTRVRVYDCRKHVVGRFVSRGHKPGDVAGVSEEAIVIWAQGGLIEILKLRPDGAGKMAAGEFARQQGWPIANEWRSWVRAA
jgi:methionyl-tRNA formyltransferase